MKRVYTDTTKTPSTRSRVLSKTETFFSEYGYRPHVSGVFGHRKRRFSNTLSRVKIFENGDSSYSCGQAKTEVLEYDDVMPSFSARSSAHTIRKRYAWTQIFFKYGEKNLRFRKYPATCGWSNTVRKHYVWTQIFLNMEKKISVFENIRLRVDGQIRFKNATCGRRSF